MPKSEKHRRQVQAAQLYLEKRLRGSPEESRKAREVFMAKKVPVSIRIDDGLIERLRNAVWHLGRGLTVTSVVEEAVGKAVRELEKQNGGKPFAARSTPIAKAPKKAMSPA